MGGFLTQLFFAILPSLAKAVLHRLIRKKEEPPKTAAEAVAEIAQKEAEVQHEVNTVNSQPMAVNDALKRLRERSAAAYPGDDRNT